MLAKLGQIGFCFFFDRFLHSASTRLFSFLVTFSSFSSLILFNVETQLQQLCLLLWLLKLLLILFRQLLLLVFELLIKFLVPLLLLLLSFTLLLLQSFLLLQDILLGRRRKRSNLQPLFHQLPSFTGTVWSHTRFIFCHYLLGCSCFQPGHIFAKLTVVLHNQQWGLLPPNYHKNPFTSTPECWEFPETLSYPRLLG